MPVAGDLSPAPAPIGMPNCVTECGGAEVPYPFGIGPDARCYLPGFNLTCDDTSYPGLSILLLDSDGPLIVADVYDSLVEKRHHHHQHRNVVRRLRRAAQTGSCRASCGDMVVPYPFGIGPSKCYWPGLDLTCGTTHDPPRLFLLGGGHFRVMSISLPNTTVSVVQDVRLVNMDPIEFTSNETEAVSRIPSLFPRETPYSLATGNELILAGCNAQATLWGHDNPAILSGCASFCPSNNTGAHGWSTNGIHGESGGGKYCYGMGCCQALISAESMDGMPKEFRFKQIRTIEPKMVASAPIMFMAEEGWFDRPGVADKVMRRTKVNVEVPLILRWEVLLLHNGSSSANVSSRPDCDWKVARELCQSKNSHCKPGNRGYSCQCNDGYHGYANIIEFSIRNVMLII
ncbi:hypothetical protein ACQ4PT_059728 [Festuca glaucescens]